jgi:hypothetical protein
VSPRFVGFWAGKSRPAHWAGKLALYRKFSREYDFAMNDSRLTDELGLLRWEVSQIESGSRMIRRNHRDVTKQELGILKLEIVFLEKIQARAAAPI